MVASILFLFAVPVTALSQPFLPDGASLVIHVMLGAGAAVMTFAVPDFRTPRWITVAGAVAIGVLALIFLLQAASDAWHSPSLTHVAYTVLGQSLEGWLGDAFVLWCVAVVLFDSSGWRKAVGIVATAIVVATRAYSHLLLARGTSINAEAPALQALSLLLFVWLLVESTRRRVDA